MLKARSGRMKNRDARNKNIAVRTNKRASTIYKTKPLAQHMMHLQQTIGNRAVQELIHSGFIQAKMKASQPGDVYEQEAERLTKQVMQVPERQVQRQIEEEEETIQAKTVGSTKPTVDSSVEDQINGLGRSQPLPDSLRSSMEATFGHDVSQVRVHTDEKAAETAQIINAKAFTIGQDIVFGPGRYAPETTEGKQLLVHELSHVVQQSHFLLSGHLPLIQRQKGALGPVGAGASILGTALALVADEVSIDGGQWHLTQRGGDVIRDEVDTDTKEIEMIHVWRLPPFSNFDIRYKLWYLWKDGSMNVKVGPDKHSFSKQSGDAATVSIENPALLYTEPDVADREIPYVTFTLLAHLDPGGIQFGPQQWWQTWQVRIEPFEGIRIWTLGKAEELYEFA